MTNWKQRFKEYFGLYTKTIDPEHWGIIKHFISKEREILIEEIKQEILELDRKTIDINSFPLKLYKAIEKL